MSTASDEYGPAGYDSRRYGRILRRSWWLIAVFAILGLLAGRAYHQQRPATFHAAASVVVRPSAADGQAAGGRNQSEVNLDTETQLVRSLATATLAAKALHSPLQPVVLARLVDVTVPPNSTVLTIGFESGTARGASDGANAFAAAYLSQRAAIGKAKLAAAESALQNQIASLRGQMAAIAAAQPFMSPHSGAFLLASSQLQSLGDQVTQLAVQAAALNGSPVDPGSVIEPATLPIGPTGPGLPIDALGGLMLGVAAGLALAVLRDRWSRRLHDASDVQRLTGAGVAATVRRRGRLPQRAQWERAASAIAADIVAAVAEDVPGRRVVADEARVVFTAARRGDSIRAAQEVTAGLQRMGRRTTLVIDGAGWLDLRGHAADDSGAQPEHPTHVESGDVRGTPAGLPARVGEGQVWAIATGDLSESPTVLALAPAVDRVVVVTRRGGSARRLTLTIDALATAARDVQVLLVDKACVERPATDRRWLRVRLPQWLSGRRAIRSTAPARVEHGATG